MIKLAVNSFPPSAAYMRQRTGSALGGGGGGGGGAELAVAINGNQCLPEPIFQSCMWIITNSLKQAFPYLRVYSSYTYIQYVPFNICFWVWKIWRRFVRIDHFFEKAQNPSMATNYSYKKCSFCIINYFETSNTAIDTLKHTISHHCVVYMKNDNANNEMIM